MNCTNCGGRMGKTALFCPKCGTARVTEDSQSAVSQQLEGNSGDAGLDQTAAAESQSASESAVALSSDGTALEQVATEGGESAAPTLAARIRALGSSVTLKQKWIAATAVLILLVVAAASFAVSANVQATQRRKVAAALAGQVKREKLNASFDALMGVRSQVLGAEAAINDAFDRVNTKSAAYVAAVKARSKQAKSQMTAYKKRVAAVKSHNASEDHKHLNSYYDYYIGYTNYYGYSYLQRYWVAPPKPSASGAVRAPDLSDETSATRGAVATLTSDLGTLTANPAEGELRSLGSQLVEVANTLIEAGNHNADVMATAINGAKIDTASLAGMHKGSGAALFATLNRTAIGFIEAHHLDVRVYDIAGGRDGSTLDSSMVTSTN